VWKTISGGIGFDRQAFGVADTRKAGQYSKRNQNKETNNPHVMGGIHADLF
jgi:hypothetical protein